MLFLIYRYDLHNLGFQMRFYGKLLAVRRQTLQILFELYQHRYIKKLNVSSNNCFSNSIDVRFLTGFLIVGTALDVGVWYHVKGLKIYDDENDNTIEVDKNRNSVEKRDSANDLKMKELGKIESKKAESQETVEKY